MKSDSIQTVRPLEAGVVYAFSDCAEPVCIVRSGDRLAIETLDCYSGQIRSSADLGNLDRSRINPATGPIRIEGAKPGDILCITIDAIELAATGIIVAGNGIGAFGAEIEGRACRIVHIVGGSVKFNDYLSIQASPMIGTIGVAPAGGSISTKDPGAHGGNLDSALIRAGARVYLPVFQDGALLAIGDVHAVMGDGEVGGTGVEAGGTVLLAVDIIKGSRIHNPVLEAGEAWVTIASAKTLDGAVDHARLDMFRLLQQSLDLPDVELAMLMSIGGSSGICQIVNSMKTARFTMPMSLCGRRLLPHT